MLGTFKNFDTWGLSLNAAKTRQFWLHPILSQSSKMDLFET